MSEEVDHVLRSTPTTGPAAGQRRGTRSPQCTRRAGRRNGRDVLDSSGKQRDAGSFILEISGFVMKSRIGEADESWAVASGSGVKNETVCR